MKYNIVLVFSCICIKIMKLHFLVFIPFYLFESNICVYIFAWNNLSILTVPLNVDPCFLFRLFTPLTCCFIVD